MGPGSTCTSRFACGQAQPHQQISVTFQPLQVHTMAAVFEHSVVVGRLHRQLPCRAGRNCHTSADIHGVPAAGGHIPHHTLEEQVGGYVL